MLARQRLNYFESMQTVAVHYFTRQIEKARSEGHQCMIIEDGGYLAPLVISRAA